MANIKVHELSSLNLSGAELFNDSESFMMELSDESEQMAILGGLAVGRSRCGLCTRGKTIVVDCGAKGQTFIVNKLVA
ncbi:hypothetical protein [Moorena bouillonii]|uniref:Uncharacterized protein n=1 Tax=Moorena bouillonii PNG TaxID=568701 RepID=A0A1U7N152_9CYAN|nr:hypothetical protein [Moorena bouillonii]OLT59666.1 hypothetical protein BJP37_12115 [Moorena bouillonii PNG]